MGIAKPLNLGDGIPDGDTMRRVTGIAQIEPENLNSVIDGLSPGLYLIKANGKPVLLVDGTGRRFPLVEGLSGVLLNVEIHELDRFEFLDFLAGSASKSGPLGVPNSVSFSYSTRFSGMPPSLSLRVEGSVGRIVKRAYSRGIALESLEISCVLRQGVTGRDILKVTANARGYATVDAPEVHLKRIVSEIISRETGFEVRAVVRGDFVRVEDLPMMRANVTGIAVGGGEIVEIPLQRDSTGVGRVRLDRNALEREVERILSEAGIGEIAENLRDTKARGEVSLGEAASVVRDSLSSLKGVTTITVNLMPGSDGYKAVLRVKRDRKLSTGTLVSMVSDALKSAQGKIRARGLMVELEKAYLIIEE